MGQLELNNLELVRAAGRHSRKDEIQSESESINNFHTDSLPSQHKTNKQPQTVRNEIIQILTPNPGKILRHLSFSSLFHHKEYKG